MAGLFRAQAIEAQKHRLTGVVSLSQPMSIHYIALSLVVFTIALIVFLLTSEYARKETVKGYLKPDKGMIRVYSDRRGAITELHVEEGQKIGKGDPLITITDSRSLTSGGELEDTLIEEIDKQISILNRELVHRKDLEHKQQHKLATDIDALERHIDDLGLQLSLISERLEIKEVLLDKSKELHQNGFISTSDFHAQKEQLLLVQHAKEQAQIDKNQSQSRLEQLQQESGMLPHQRSLQILEIEKKLTIFLRQRTEVQNRFRYVIRATSNGTVTAIQTAIGEYISSSVPLMSVIPEGAVLVAELLLPSRSAGFVRKGDTTRLRFDAFPYQRFGSMASHVYQVDKVVLEQNDSRLPIPMNEPVYRVQAKLPVQSLNAYGESFQLKSGMQLEADIILESRNLVQWLLDPIYSLKGRVG
ncbi:HlyD family secretion protein [Ferrimonas kyonanensis]|uniref:HlyD family secretion protein n=1 Tax=Ferrimonas kyonanensis TaxID=364763 RepID=UPI0004221835|nr:HlyD family efflux transporter periplasmic adaptor subunit [Ferrimonas kyonanensis]